MNIHTRLDWKRTCNSLRRRIRRSLKNG